MQLTAARREYRLAGNRHAWTVAAGSHANDGFGLSSETARSGVDETSRTSAIAALSDFSGSMDFGLRSCGPRPAVLSPVESAGCGNATIRPVRQTENAMATSICRVRQAVCSARLDSTR
jgi:hypothetical protein